MEDQKEVALDRTIREMKSLAQTLVPYSFPQKHSDFENEISLLKTREMVFIDGYEVIIFFGRAEYTDYALETFQIFGQRVPFLPFHLVLKAARKFLGDDNLILIEVYANNKKLYVWTKRLDLDGKSETPVDGTTISEYRGFKFHRLEPDRVSFL